MPPFLLSDMGNETSRNNREGNEIFNGPTQPSQAQLTGGEREESKNDLAIDMHSSEAQFGHYHQHHRSIQSEMRRRGDQYSANMLPAPASISAPETKVGQPNDVDSIPQDQMQQVRDTIHYVQQNTQTRDLQVEIIRLQKQLEKYEVEDTRLRTYIAHVEKRAEAAEKRQVDEHQFYQRNIPKFQAHIHKLDSQIRGLRSQVVSYEAEKSKNKAIANSRKVSDDAIKSGWKTMAYNIKSLVATTLTGCPSRHDLNHHGHENKEESCAFCEMNASEIDLLQSDDMRASVVEKVVWDAVTRRVLSHDKFDFGRSWAGVPGQFLCNLFGKLLGVPEMATKPDVLLRWKAESAAMIDKALGVDNRELEAAVYEEMRGLRKFIPRDCPNTRAVRQSLYQELREVFKEAVEIHRMLMQSRAHFYVDQMETEGVVHYNPEYHEAEAWDKTLNEKSVVLLGVSPSLIKVGNADGDNYDKSTRLIKASVICD